MEVRQVKADDRLINGADPQTNLGPLMRWRVAFDR